MNLTKDFIIEHWLFLLKFIRDEYKSMDVIIPEGSINVLESQGVFYSGGEMIAKINVTYDTINIKENKFNNSEYVIGDLTRHLLKYKRKYNILKCLEIK